MVRGRRNQFSRRPRRRVSVTVVVTQLLPLNVTRYILHTVSIQYIYYSSNYKPRAHYTSTSCLRCLPPRCPHTCAQHSVLSLDSHAAHNIKRNVVAWIVLRGPWCECAGRSQWVRPSPLLVRLCCGGGSHDAPLPERTRLSGAPSDRAPSCRLAVATPP